MTMFSNFVVLMLLGLCIYLFFVFPTKWLKIEHVKLDMGLDKKILQISDLHIKNLRVKTRDIVNIILEENPDYIFYTGDFIDKDAKELSLLNDFLSEISGFGIESYAVLGNHDRYLDNVDALISLLKKHEVTTLMNENVNMENFFLVGIDDFCRGHHDIDKSFNSINLNLSKPIIAITHDPNIVLHMERKFSYLMAGHLHGKQINIPFLFRVKKMGELPRRGIYKGLNKGPVGMFYISKGIGQSRINVRFLVRSEVTIHQL